MGAKSIGVQHAKDVEFAMVEFVCGLEKLGEETTLLFVLSLMALFGVRNHKNINTVGATTSNRPIFLIWKTLII
jgi:hypothetical protein